MGNGGRATMLALAAAMVAGASGAQAQRLTNGGFEATPNAPWRIDATAPGGHVQSFSGGALVTAQYLPGWRIVNPVESDLHRSPCVYGGYPAAAAEGLNYFALNWSNDGGRALYNEIEQDFTLGNGADGFELSLLMSSEVGVAGSTLVATIRDDRGAVVAQSPAWTNTRGNRVWDAKSWTATGLGGGRYTLRLAGTGAANAWDVLVDGVDLQQRGGLAAVPEPATWALMIGGFGAVGGSLRRRSSARGGSAWGRAPG